MTLRLILLAIFSPFLLHAQTTETHRHTKHKHAIKATALPPWAAAHKYNADAHVYFPDYYTFYDPNRGGYIFWENGTWSFTPTMPAYLSNKDLDRSRVQILKNVSLDLHPETDYPRYMKLYPPRPDGNYKDVPVPAAQGMSGAQ
ncbi:MAG: hypothetical protein P4L41_10670 [Flavipsychrobacter sp.]|nr:hypothetical protein [Flavipsychrobacter sp.]